MGTEQEKSPLLQKLGQVYKIAPETLRPDIKSIADDIKALEAVAERVQDERDRLDMEAQALKDQHPLPEAPASANVFLFHLQSLAKVQFTVRGYILSDVTDDIIGLIDQLTKNGWMSEDSYIDMRRAARNEQPASPVSQTSATPPPAEGGDYFLAESIAAAQMSDKKPDLVWKIKGNKSKFPVPIYEPIDEAKPALAKEGVDLSSFTTQDGKLRSYQLNGWWAYYEKNDKGYPVKVTKLVKAA